jgi:hypothetical protein
MAALLEEETELHDEAAAVAVESGDNDDAALSSTLGERPPRASLLYAAA